MSPLLIAALLGFFVLLFSQFGSRLAARTSLVWWLIAAFMLVAAIRPELLQPLAHAFGVELVSNFVLAGLVLFLLLQAVEQSAEAATAARRFRDLVSSTAAQAFLARSAPIAAGDRRALVVVPSYNEEESIPALIPKLEEIVRNAELPCDYCIVDDGSTDGTWRILAEMAPKCSVKHGANVGVAGALLTGFKVAVQGGYAFVVQCDGDGQHAPQDIPRMLREASEGRFDLVIGSRFASTVNAKAGCLDSTTRIRRFGARIVNAVLALFGRTARGVRDPTSGFRVYSARAVRTLMTVMPDDYPEPESIAILALRGLRIVEVSVRMAPRATGHSTLTGLKSIRYMIKVTSALTGLRLRSLLRASH
jgi:hypothetical protein